MKERDIFGGSKHTLTPHTYFHFSGDSGPPQSPRIYAPCTENRVLYRPESCGRQSVGNEVHPEQLDGDECLGHAERRREEDTDDLADVGRDEVADELLHVVVDGATLLHGRHDRREVVVGEHHLRRGLGDRRARSHRDTDLGLLQRRRVVHPVASLNIQQSVRVTRVVTNSSTLSLSVLMAIFQVNLG